jgi:hypothetical protein
VVARPILEAPHHVGEARLESLGPEDLRVSRGPHQRAPQPALLLECQRVAAPERPPAAAGQLADQVPARVLDRRRRRDDFRQRLPEPFAVADISQRQQAPDLCGDGGALCG